MKVHFNDKLKIYIKNICQFYFLFLVEKYFNPFFKLYIMLINVWESINYQNEGLISY